VVRARQDIAALIAADSVPDWAHDLDAQELDEER
jgi:hypothetical protein